MVSLLAVITRDSTIRIMRPPSVMAYCTRQTLLFFSSHIDACSCKRAMIFLATESKSFS